MTHALKKQLAACPRNAVPAAGLFISAGTLRKRFVAELDKLVAVLKRETDETKQALHVLWRLSRGEKVSKRDRDGAARQLADLAKLVPALAIFSLPGGIIFLPLLAKILPFNLLPVKSFEDCPDEGGHALKRQEAEPRIAHHPEDVRK